MKVWQAYSSEHSARVKIIGTFMTPEDAQAAAALFNRLIDIKDESIETNPAAFLTAIMKTCSENDLADFAPSDAPQLRWFETVYPAGIEIRVETSGTDIQALLKVMMRYGARVEILSRPTASTQSLQKPRP
jgi:hypothetical protein